MREPKYMNEVQNCMFEHSVHHYFFNMIRLYVIRLAILHGRRWNVESGKGNVIYLDTDHKVAKYRN